MDGFDSNNGVIVMAATNLEKSLDAALTRAGRFDRHVTVPLPDVKGRTEIIDHYLKASRVFLAVRCQHAVPPPVTAAVTACQHFSSAHDLWQWSPERRSGSESLMCSRASLCRAGPWQTMWLSALLVILGI